MMTGTTAFMQSVHMHYTTILIIYYYVQGEISSMHCTIQDSWGAPSNEEKQDAFDELIDMLTEGSLYTACG